MDEEEMRLVDWLAQRFGVRRRLGYLLVALLSLLIVLVFWLVGMNW